MANVLVFFSNNVSFFLQQATGRGSTGRQVFGFFIDVPEPVLHARAERLFLQQKDLGERADGGRRGRARGGLKAAEKDGRRPRVRFSMATLRRPARAPRRSPPACPER